MLVIGLAAASTLLVGVAAAQTTTDPPTTPPTTAPPTTAPPTTEPPPTEPPPTSPPTTAAPPRSTTTAPRSTTTRPPPTTTTEPPPTTAPTTTSTTAAPAVVLPGNTTTVPPTDGGGNGDGGGPSSRRQLAMVVGGLVAVAGGLSALTFLYWRRTRPVPYNAALDALGDLAGPAPLTPAGSVVAGEPTVVTPRVTAPVPTRTPEQAAALLAALVAAEEAEARAPDGTGSDAAAVPEPTPEPATGGLSNQAPPVEAFPAIPGNGSGGPPPIEPGGPGFRVMGAVAAAGIGDGLGERDESAPVPAAAEDQRADSPPIAGTGSTAPMPGVGTHQFVTREELDVASPSPDSPTVADPLALLLAETEPDASSPPSPGRDGS